MGASSGGFAIANLDIDGGTDIGADLVDADEIIVDDGGGGTNRRSDLTRVKKYIFSALSGDATASDSGALTIANGSVENAMLLVLLQMINYLVLLQIVNYLIVQ